MDLVAVGRQDANPLLVKLGVALALSFAGLVVVQRRSGARPRLPSYFASGRHRSSSGANSRAIGKSRLGLKELQILKSDETFPKIVNGTSRTTSTTTVVGLSPTRRSSGVQERFLSQEFNNLVMKELIATLKDTELNTITPTPKKSETKEDIALEQEISRLRNLVWYLEERESSLELQLLEYYGMQEQEAAVRELESQLKLNAVEAKLYSSKIESLESDNQRLQAQLRDISKAMNELEAARPTIKLLKKQLKLDGEQAKEKIDSLHQRISSLQCLEQMEAKNNEEIERQFKRLKALEDESAELKIVNSRLEEENSDLVRKLESTQASASSAVEGPEMDKLEEVNSLREANEKLTKDIEQLKTDRCADVEELVYLRWINACLRYELRNYQSRPGKTVAKDLSKSSSLKSKEKAKQLILEYASSGTDENSFCFTDFESEYSSSQASTREPEETSIDVSSSTGPSSSKKTKFISKLKKLVLRKGTHGNKALAFGRTSTSSDSSEKRVSASTCSNDDMIGRASFGSSSSCTTEELSPANPQPDERCHDANLRSQIYCRPSLDIQSLQSLKLEDARDEKGEHYKRDVGTPYGYERMGSGEGALQEYENCESPEKVEIQKYAAALKRTR